MIDNAQRRRRTWNSRTPSPSSPEARAASAGIAYGLAKEGVRIVVADLPAVSADRDETIAESSASAATRSPSTSTSRLRAVPGDGPGRHRQVGPGRHPREQRRRHQGRAGIHVRRGGLGPRPGRQREGHIPLLESRCAARSSAASGVSSTSRRWRKEQQNRVVVLRVEVGCDRLHAAMAEEMGQFNVTVNAICPGEVDTYIMARGADAGDRPHARHLEEQAWEEAAVKNVPLGRPQTVADMGQAVVFLCKADNITGDRSTSPAARRCTRRALRMNRNRQNLTFSTTGSRFCVLGSATEGA